MPYVGGVHTYRATCDAVAADGYAGFAIDGKGTPPADCGVFLPETEPA